MARSATAGTGNAARARRMCPPGSPSWSLRASTMSRPIPDTTPNCPAWETCDASRQEDTAAPMPPWMMLGRLSLSAESACGVFAILVAIGRLSRPSLQDNLRNRRWRGRTSRHSCGGCRAVTRRSCAAGRLAGVLRRIDLRGQELSTRELLAVVPRAEIDIDAALTTVRPILADVQARGEAALREYGERFDGGSPAQLRVAADEIEESLTRLDPAVRAGLEEAICL